MRELDTSCIVGRVLCMQCSTLAFHLDTALDSVCPYQFFLFLVMDPHCSCLWDWPLHVMGDDILEAIEGK